METCFDEIEIKKVLQRKDGIKMVIIPKKSKIEKGQYVAVLKNSTFSLLINKYKQEEK